MLYLTLKPNQSVVLDTPEGRVTVVFRGDSPYKANAVLLGLDAPRHIRIDREEVHRERLAEAAAPRSGCGHGVHPHICCAEGVCFDCSTTPPP